MKPMLNLLLLNLLLPSLVRSEGQILDTQEVTEGVKIGTEVSNFRKLLQRPGEFTAEQLADKKTRIYFANKAKSRPFEMSPRGTIRVAGPVDREQICDPRNKERMRESRHICSPEKCCILLQVQVDIGGAQTLKHYFVKVVIIDVNDNAPTFSVWSESGEGTTLHVAEDAKVGTTRLQLATATDADSPQYGVKKYTWTDFTPPSIKNHFKLAEDEHMRPYLEVVSSLNREVQAKYTFTLVAEDGGYAPKTGTMSYRIIVTDVNDNKPTFDRKKYTAIVKEGKVMNTGINFSVTDLDEGQNAEITYRIVDKSNRANQFFQLTSTNTGAYLSIKREIDYEKDGDHFDFKVMASDRGTPPKSSLADVNIRVLNVNDHKPEIIFLKDGKNLGSAYGNVIVQEGQGNNQVITQVHVSDKDSQNQDIECKVIKGSDHFHLEENRQVNMYLTNKQYNLRSKFAFDREVQSSYTVKIQCEDNAKDHKDTQTSTAQLAVQVEDLNDNAPQFTRSKYFGWINENARDSGVEMQEKIEAKDVDDGDNQVITYSLMDLPDRTDSQSFVLNSHTPSLHSREALDYETKKEYRFIVVARDHGKPSLNATSQVVIKVRDGNDNAPVLNQANYNFKVMEEEDAPQIVGHVTATDKDTDPINREVIYSIQNYNPTQPFRATDYLSIGTHDGIIRTKRPIDREKVESLVFTVSARNKVPLEHVSKVTAEAIVHVTILDRNDNKPVMKPNQPNKHIEMTLDADRKAENCVPFSLEFVDNDSSEEGNGRVEVSLGTDQMTRKFTLRENNRLLCISRQRLPDGSLGDPIPVNSGTYFITVLARDMPINGTAQETKEKIIVQVRKRPPVPRREVTRITGDRRGSSADSRNVTIIAVLASIAGLFCLILLVIIFVFKKCAPLPEKDECSDKYDVSCPENAATLGRGHGTLDYRTTGSSRPEACGLLGSRLADMELDACEDVPPGHTTLRYETQWRTPKAARRCPSDEPAKKLSKSCESLEGPGGRQLFNALEDAQNGYQVLDPVLTLKTRTSMSAGPGGGGVSPEERGAKERNSGGYQDLNDQTLGGKKNNNYYDCVTEAEAMYSPRRSLKNAYFQTSFV